MAWATVVTVVSGSPYERKMLATSSISAAEAEQLGPQRGAAGVGTDGLPFLSRVFRVVVLGIRPGRQIAPQTHRDRPGRETSARPAVTTSPVEFTTADRPAARAKGTVNPSDIPMTMSRIVSDEVKCVSTCGVVASRLPSNRLASCSLPLLPDFSPAVLAETDAVASAPAETNPSIRDLRGLLWSSIDDDDSRDLDQLSVAEPRGRGTVKIPVAIADVDAVVRQGSAIDGHARIITTLVYTAAEVFSMLPEKLSTDLTSLGEGRERLAIVIEMEDGGSDKGTWVRIL
jgi:RNB domain